MLATTQLWAIADRGLVLTPPTPSVLGTPVPQVGGKCQHHSSDQGVPTPEGPLQDEEEAGNIDEEPEECPHRKHKEGKALKDPQREAFSKDSDVMKAARWAYQKAHGANFEQEESYDLSSIFCQMAISTNLLSTKVYKVQETWTAKRTSGPLIKWEGPLQKTSTFSGSSHPQSHQRSWASRASIPPRPYNDEVA